MELNNENIASPMRTYVVMILDKSGSMEDIKKVALNGFNEHIQTLISEGDKGGETFVSLVTFNSKVNADYFNVPTGSLRELTEEAYQPNGWTAYYDAVAYTLDRLKNETNFDDPNNAYLIICISDGDDNRSKTSKSAIAKRISQLKETNKWTFVYIGANQNLDDIQNGLNIDAGNVYRGWDASSLESTAVMADSMNKNSRMYFAARSKGLTSVSNYCGLSEDVKTESIDVKATSNFLNGDWKFNPVDDGENKNA